MKRIFSFLVVGAIISTSVLAAGPVGDIICGPVAIRREDGTELQRLAPTLLMTHIDDAVNEVALQKEFTAADFKDAKFEGRLFLRAKGQRLDDSYPDGLKGKFILTMNYYHYTFSPNGDKVGHASGYSQGNLFEPLTGNADGDDKVLKSAGGTCMFFADGTAPIHGLNNLP